MGFLLPQAFFFCAVVDHIDCTPVTLFLALHNALVVTDYIEESFTKKAREILAPPLTAGGLCGGTFGEGESIKTTFDEHFSLKMIASLG